MIIKAYLDRLGMNNDIRPDLQSLKEIQKNHLLKIPFENLDIHIHHNINIDKEYLFHKIVSNHRGGICYEVNYLLYHLLKELGYKVKLLGGKALGEKGTYQDHLLLCVVLDKKKYLVDVGYGDNFLEPLEWVDGKEQTDNKGTFRIDRIGEGSYQLRKWDTTDLTYKVAYDFLAKEMPIADFTERIAYFVHSEESIFKKNLFCSLEKVDGRVSLKPEKMIVTDNREKTIHEIQSFDDYIRKLQDTFNIVLAKEQQFSLRKLWQPQ